MDSHSYNYFISDCIDNAKNVSQDLPVQLLSKTIAPNKNSFQALSFFLREMMPEYHQDNAAQFPIPEILNVSDYNTFKALFVQAHRAIAEQFSGDEKISTDSFKYNGTELLKLLTYVASPNWIPLFADRDITALAMSCFLIEACMNCGWCPNAFENRAKWAAHIYFINVKKSLYRVHDNDLTTIVGYIQGAWLCAQKTEGIKDKVSEWATKESTSHFSWNSTIDDETVRLKYAAYKFPESSQFYLIPENNNRTTHPFAKLKNEQKTGLTLFYKDAPIVPSKLVENTPIDRPEIKGEKFVYTCDISNSLQIRWMIVIQFLGAVVYRIDLAVPTRGTCMISKSELRIENSVPLSKSKEGHYIGYGYYNTIVKLDKNPFSIEYAHQEEDEISLFQGPQSILSSEKPFEMTTAWSRGRNITSINETCLPGNFNLT